MPAPKPILRMRHFTSIFIDCAIVSAMNDKCVEHNKYGRLLIGTYGHSIKPSDNFIESC